jgi:hypothetical protein
VKLGEDWKIDCEEDAKHYENATGPLTNECKI